MSSLNLIAFISNHANIDNRLMDAFRLSWGSGEFHLCTDIGAFIESVRTGPSGAVALVIAGRKGELIELGRFGRSIHKTLLVLILPDRSDETAALGYKLRPRFVSCLDADLMEAAMVLRHIADHVGRDQSILKSEQVFTAGV